MENYEDYQTLLVQEVGDKTGAISPSITPSASYGYENSKEAEGIFDGSVKKPLYARVGNPTGSKLENLLAKMDSGAGAIATSSGMSAISLATLSLLAVGDEVISIGGLFGGTFAYFDETLVRFGIKTTFISADNIDDIQKNINDTKYQLNLTMQHIFQTKQSSLIILRDNFALNDPKNKIKTTYAQITKENKPISLETLDKNDIINLEDPQYKITAKILDKIKI